MGLSDLHKARTVDLLLGDRVEIFNLYRDRRKGICYGEF